jgi:hypothetical protein
LAKNGMTRLKAKRFGTTCALVALVPASMLAGILGFDKMDGGIGFFPFLVYVSALLLGFVLLSHFAPLAEDQHEKLASILNVAKLVGSGLVLIIGSVTLVMESAWGIIGSTAMSIGGFLPPAILLVLSFITRQYESNPL